MKVADSGVATEVAPTPAAQRSESFQPLALRRQSWYAALRWLGVPKTRAAPTRRHFLHREFHPSSH
jgi:hypothetical protein